MRRPARRGGGGAPRGDFFAVGTLRRIGALCPGPVHAVHGNVDEAELRAALPEALEIELDGARVAMVHDAGPAKGRLGRMRRRCPEVDAVVFGRPIFEHVWL